MREQISSSHGVVDPTGPRNFSLGGLAAAPNSAYFDLGLTHGHQVHSSRHDDPSGFSSEASIRLLWLDMYTLF